jgi:hypothetical protein
MLYLTMSMVIQIRDGSVKTDLLAVPLLIYRLLAHSASSALMGKTSYFLTLHKIEIFQRFSLSGINRNSTVNIEYFNYNASLCQK